MIGFGVGEEDKKPARIPAPNAFLQPHKNFRYNSL